MKNFFLTKVRLTYYYPCLFIIFVLLIMFVPKQQLSGGPLALFSINSFLLAFYLGPILAGQKSRIDELAKTIRSESIAFFNIAIQSQGLTKETKHEVKNLARTYLKASSKAQKPVEGEVEYEKMIRYCLEYKGKDADQIVKIRDILVANQQNRGQLSLLLMARVFSHEWFVLLVLFAITVSYVVIIDYGRELILTLVAALLCTGLTLLMLILEKLNTLTHKKAKTMWAPFDNLLATDFKHIDE